MKRRAVTVILLSALIVIPAVTGSAVKPAATFPVIVVFDDDAPFGDFRGHFALDERFATAFDKWGHLDSDVMGTVQAFERAHGFSASHAFSATIKGFAAKLTARQIQALEDLPFVKYIEPDDTVSISQQTLPWGINRVDADISSTLAGNGTGSVTNVRVHVIDTGVAAVSDINRVQHVNFTGDGQNTDCNGHGTHVAGTAAARDNTINVVGVAPGAPVVGVKVLTCGGSGTNSGVIAGVDWVTANAVKPAVANMSLGGGASTALDDAVRRSVASGVFYAVAAGNNGGNACNSSPSRAGAGTNNGIASTAATDINNREPSFSNFGSCVDIWAPGVSVLSTSRSGGTTTLSGTSMASPHVAGSAALFLSSNTSASPATIESNLKSNTLSFGTLSKDGRTIRIVNVRNF